MVDDRTEMLLQAAAFGEASVDADALAAILSGSEEARRRLAQLEALAAALQAEGAVGPPAGLTQTVLEAVRDGRSRRDTRGDRGGEVMSKKWIVGIAATVAAALGIYVAAGGRIPPQGTEGTIGAAKRYQGQQISAADVQLGDQAMQTFLQTSTFDTLRRDPALRRSFLTVVSSPAFARLANDAAFARLASSDAFLALATDADLKRLTMDAALAELASDANFKQLASDAEFKQLVNDAGFKRLMIDADFMKLMEDANFAKLLQDANLKQLLTDANLKRLSNDAEFARLARDTALTNRKSGEGQKDYY